MTTSFERLASGAADLSDDAARSLLSGSFGIDAAALSALDGESDRNVLVDAADGARYVLKVAASTADPAEVDLQLAVLRHLASAELGVAVPEVIGDAVEVELPSGRHLAHVLTFVPGIGMRDVVYRSPELLEQLGATAARLVEALSTFEHSGEARSHHWDVQVIPQAVAECLPYVDDAADRALVERIVGWIGSLDGLPLGVCHQDLNDHNVLCSRDDGGAMRIASVLDVGDALRTVRIGELAVAAAYAMRDADDPLECLSHVVCGYHAVLPLEGAEADVLFPLAAGRLCVNVTTWTRRLAMEPDNTYAVDRMRGSWDMLRRFGAIDPALATAVVRAACGFGSTRPSVLPALLLDTSGLANIDLSPDGDLFDTADVVDVDVPEGVVPFGSIDLTRTAPGGGDTLLLGSRVVGMAGSQVAVPDGATVERQGEDHLILRHDGAFIVLRGLSTDGAASDDLFVQVTTSLPADGLPMAYAKPWMREAALTVFGDPSGLLGRPAAVVTTSRVDEVVTLRSQRFAPSQRAYYRRPMNLVRAKGVWFYDEDGNAYLDAVNNVTHIGHGHPHIVEAVHRQMHRLNTNSRFVYAQLADYAERLVSKLPPPLDTVYLACTGSEANDLALRISRTVTGRQPVVVIGGAYHGNTIAVTDISPNRYRVVTDTPPPTTCEVPMPDRYRGPYGDDDPDAGARYAALAGAEMDRYDPPAAVIAEPLMGTAGHIIHPDGYIAALFADVRARGGLCISDEVQVGFGRMGDHFWGFQMHGVVPDIVTMGKPIGNGFPLSAVVTTRAIAEAFDNGIRYFNTFGGNPVACAAGMAVLDVIENEGLQARAADVGGYLKERLASLMDRHEMVGDVRGHGLYVGVELVRDRETKEPAKREAFHISERMKDLGMIAYPTGFDDNILKLKPPMVFGREHADLYADALDRVLTDGW